MTLFTRIRFFGLCCFLILGSIAFQGFAQPTGFVDQLVSDSWDGAVGLTFDANGRMYVWEKSGKVWIVENGVKSAQPLIDISEEVGNWRDYGLLGFALHPDFNNNGYLYLLYTVDRHHLLHHGTSIYSSAQNEYFDATISRLTRYTAKASDQFNSVDPDTHKVLIGETIDTGFPVLHQSHGPGTLLFGEDGSLLVSHGDASSYTGVDNGGGGAVGDSYAPQGILDGIISADQDAGAYRAQMIQSLSGKILRIDPNTGNGYPSNPFYDPIDPRSPRSRVWALGLRNPYRLALRPETGSHDPVEGDPGIIYLGDVGWADWEELNVVTAGGMNFGWPLFEGLEVQNDYTNQTTPNMGAPNPLFGTGGCTEAYFSFQDLIQQATLNPTSFPNPCNPAQEITGAEVFLHARPAIDWGHGNGPARAGIWEGGAAAVIDVGAPGSPVSGPQSAGNASTGGFWYTGDNFPPEYKNTYFHADYDKKWIQNFKFNQQNEPISIAPFLEDREGIVALTMNPTDGSLYYISYANEIRSITYSPNANQAPTAVVKSDKTFGSGPLTVQFQGINSSDPEGGALQYLWNFGDGTATSTTSNPSHTFLPVSGVPTMYTVSLTVTDPGGVIGQTTYVISANNTPPAINITSPIDGSKYPFTSGDLTYSLTASVLDGEHTPAELTYEWQTILNHNSHAHPESTDNNPTTTTVISPVGCNGESFSYTIRLTVTDAAGLSSTKEVTLLPQCLPIAVEDRLNFSPGNLTELEVLANDYHADGAIDETTVAIVQQPSHGTVQVDPVTGVIKYQHDGSEMKADTISYKVKDLEGLDSQEAYIYLNQWDPSGITVVGPVNEKPVGLKNVPLNYNLSGDPLVFNSLKYQLDGGPLITVNNLEAAVVLENLNLGSHTLSVQLFQDAVALTNSEARDEIIFEVVSTGGGLGLVGEYFNNPTLVDPADTVLVDPIIDLFWDRNVQPVPQLDDDNFSIRWTGFVEAVFTEDYKIYFNVDDGGKVTFDGQLIVDAFIPQALTEYNGTVSLVAGEKYPIIIEYNDIGGAGTAQLSWSSLSQPKSIIPQDNLFTPDQVVGLPGDLDDLAIGIYPNPNDGVFQVAVRGLESNQEVSLLVHDIYGRILYRELNSTDNQGGLSNKIKLGAPLSSGVYFVSVNAEDKTYKAKLVVK